MEECPNYIVSRGVRSGCRFAGTSLPLFTDINLCVNGSSPEGPLRAQFISLQIQNHGTHAPIPVFDGGKKVSSPRSSHPDIVFTIVFPVKPPTTERVNVHAGPNKLEIDWECPAGGVPVRCLEWEVEHRLEGPGGKNTLVIVFCSPMIIVQRERGGGATCNTCVCDESEILNSVQKMNC